METNLIDSPFSSPLSSPEPLFPSLSADMLWAVFAVGVLAAFVMSAILFYHRAAYGYGLLRKTAAAIVYAAGAIFLLTAAAVFLSLYISSL